MKVYCGSNDWADEGDVFFYSLETEERLQAMKKLIEVFSKAGLNFNTDMYWGTNQWFDFDTETFIDFIDEAVDISEEEIKVFEKFKVRGFDIYDRMLYHIYRVINNDIEYLTEEELREIEQAFITLFDKEKWNRFKNVVNIETEE